MDDEHVRLVSMIQDVLEGTGIEPAEVQRIVTKWRTRSVNAESEAERKFWESMAQGFERYGDELRGAS